MTFRVIHLQTGETFARYALHQFEHAVAAALDVAAVTGESFAVATAAGTAPPLFVTAKERPPPR